MPSDPESETVICRKATLPGRGKNGRTSERQTDMAIEASLVFDLREFERHMTDVERSQMPSAVMLTLNDVAFGGRKAVQGQMEGDLDRPTPYAKRGVVVEKASKRDLEAKVVIYGHRSAKGGLPAAYFLGPQVHGGKRSLKAFEKQLVGLRLMPANHVAVPARRQKLDRYGNVSQGQLNKILSGLKVDYRGAGATRVASTEAGKTRQRRRGRYFVAQDGSHLHPGIYQASPTGTTIFPLMLFVPISSYAKRLDFDGPIRRHAGRNMARYFAANWQKANATRR